MQARRKKTSLCCHTLRLDLRLDLRLCGVFFCWLFFLLFSVQVHAQQSITFDVEITGAQRLTELLDKNLEIRRHQNDKSVNEEEWQRLINITPQQIRDLVSTEGYFSSTVESRVTQEDGTRVAHFNVTLGSPVRVTAVDIQFAGDISEESNQTNNSNKRRRERLQRQWALDKGEIFRQEDWTEAKNTLLKNLLVHDYPGAEITASEARIDPELHTATLSVQIDSGPAFTFGELELDGLNRYSRKMIDDLNPIKPGDRYSQEQLNELQARLQATGYFLSAFATIEVDRAHPQHVPVHVELNENQRKHLSFGIGFSTDAGLRLSTRWLDRKFMSRDWRLESELLLDNKTKRLTGNLVLPTLRNGWSPSLNARYEQEDSSGEITDTIRLGAQVSSPIKADEKTWSIAYLADRQRIGDTFLNNRQALFGAFLYTRRRIDNLVSPRNGYVASISLGAGPPGLINSQSFARAVARVVSLSMLDRHWQTIVRGEVGQVFGASRQVIPSDLLFRTGGDQTVRGYAYDSLGVSQDGAIVGGTVSAVISAEVVYWLTSEWGAAVFTDAGNAADSWKGFTLNKGSGIGARWRSPIGSVSVDLAYGYTTHEPKLHFTVGYGF